MTSESEGDSDEEASDAFESSCENLDSPVLHLNPLDSGSVTPTSARPGQEDEGRALISDTATPAPGNGDEARSQKLLTTLASNKFSPLVAAATQESRKRKATTLSPEGAAVKRDKKKARKQRKRAKLAHSPH